MQDRLDVTKRSLLTGALAVGTGAAALGSMMRDARAQLLESGIDSKSVLAKIKKGGALEVGYAQLPLWFYKDAKSGELKGVYKDLVELLAKDLEMTVNWHEVTFANSTIGLRSGDYDLFGSSATYTVPRATVCNYVGPLWSKGSLAVIRKADAGKYQTTGDQAMSSGCRPFSPRQSSWPWPANTPWPPNPCVRAVSTRVSSETLKHLLLPSGIRNGL
jgi:polar amino acid transport system substrate-binding protein